MFFVVLIGFLVYSICALLSILGNKAFGPNAPIRGNKKDMRLFKLNLSFAW
jgi:hypothetical protein